MKRTILSLVITGGCLAGIPAMGQETPAKKTTQHRQTHSGFVRAMDVTGSAVQNQDDEKIGTVDRLLIDSQTGAVRFAVINATEYVGSDKHQVAIPWGAFQIQRSASTTGAEGKPTLVLNAAKEKLKNAPKFDPDKERELYESSQSEPVFIYWEVLWLDPKDQNNGTSRGDNRLDRQPENERNSEENEKGERRDP